MLQKLTYHPMMRTDSSSNCKLSQIRSSISAFMTSLNYDEFNEYNLLETIPEHDLKVLCALAKKRELDCERNKLATEFRKLWEQEKLERQKFSERSSHEYKRYIVAKRAQERRHDEQRRLEQLIDLELRTGHLMDQIMRKEQRSAMRLACRDDEKNTRLINKAIEGNARFMLASDRRLQKIAEDAHRRELNLAYAHRKAMEAKRRKKEMLRDAAERVAIHNAFSTWECSIARREMMTLEAMKVAQHAAKLAVTEARSNHLLRAKERKMKRARILATVTSQLRDAVKAGVY